MATYHRLNNGKDENWKYIQYLAGKPNHRLHRIGVDDCDDTMFITIENDEDILVIRKLDEDDEDLNARIPMRRKDLCSLQSEVQEQTKKARTMEESVRRMSEDLDEVKKICDQYTKAKSSQNNLNKLSMCVIVVLVAIVVAFFIMSNSSEIESIPTEDSPIEDITSVLKDRIENIERIVNESLNDQKENEKVRGIAAMQVATSIAQSGVLGWELALPGSPSLEVQKKECAEYFTLMKDKQRFQFHKAGRYLIHARFFAYSLIYGKILLNGDLVADGYSGKVQDGYSAGTTSTFYFDASEGDVISFSTREKISPGNEKKNNVLIVKLK